MLSPFGFIAFSRGYSLTNPVVLDIMLSTAFACDPLSLA